MYTVIKNGERHCIMCGETKPLDAFGSYRYTTKSGNPSRRYSSRCKECERKRRKEHYHADPERDKASSKKWRSKNKEHIRAYTKGYKAENRDHILLDKRNYQAIQQAKLHGAAIIDANAETYRRVLEEARFGEMYLDAYSMELIDDPVIDHVIPLSNGGDHTYSNMCVTTRENNSSKWNKSLIYWIATR